MVEKLIFSQTFEGLLRVVGSRQMTPVIEEGLRARGLDVKRPLLPAYDHRVFLEVVPFLAKHLHPRLGEDPAIVALARDFVDAFGFTLIGRALLAMIRVIGPRRTLERLTRQLRTANNFSQTRVTERSATGYDVWVNEVAMPGWYQGIFERGLELAGAHQVKVVLAERSAGAGTFRVDWSAT